MVTTCPCGVQFEAKRATRVYHSDTCRKRHSRAGSKVPRTAAGVVRLTIPPLNVDGEPEAPLVVVTRTALDEAGRIDTPLGQLALALAAAASNPRLDVGRAATAKEYRATLEAALEGANVVKGLAETLRDRANERRSSAG